MFRHAVLALLLLAAPACWAQDCTADVDLAAGLRLDVHYRCRSTAPLVFDPGGRVEPKNGVVDLHYKVDLANRDADSRELIVRGQGTDKGALATLGTWLAEPRGHGHLPVIDIRVKAAGGLVFSSGLP